MHETGPVLVDHRERSSAIPDALVAAGLDVRLTDLPVGAVASIARIATSSAARMSRLASFGIAAGSEVRVIARRPAIVLACGSSSIAIDDEVGREIFVQLTSRG